MLRGENVRGAPRPASHLLTEARQDRQRCLGILFSVANTGKRQTVSARPVLRSTADFARYVGLARTTVSRVLNGQPGLKRKTIDRVNRALAETGFTPNAYALHLKGKRTAMIGLCVEDAAAPLTVRKLAALQRTLRARGYSSLIEMAAPEASRDAVRQFLSLRVEGVVFLGQFAPAEIEARLGELALQGIAHLIIDCPGVKNAPSVALDRTAGWAMATDYLCGLGHRRFGLIGFAKAPGRYDGTAGVAAALKARGLSFDRCVTTLDAAAPRQGNLRDDFEYGRAVGALLVDQSARPTALLAHNDAIAIGVLRALLDAGLKVPRDVSIFGFDNESLGRMVAPTLSSVDGDIDLAMEVAADTLLEQLNQPARSRSLTRWIEPRLMVRASIGVAKAPPAVVR